MRWISNGIVMISVMEMIRIERSPTVLRPLMALCILFSCSLLAQQPLPGPAQTRSILITGGTVHVGDGRVFEEGAVGLRNGKIDFVGYGYGVRASYDTTIHANGQHIYPGFIGLCSSLGLTEIESIRASRDFQDVGHFEPELRTITSYKADSRIIPTVRSNGVLIAQISPKGLVISGTSSIVQLDAWDWEEATVRSDEGVFMTWPPAYQRRGWWAEQQETDAAAKDERQKKLDEIREFFGRAKAYSAVALPEKKDLRCEAMRGLFDGRRTLYVHADAAREITEAVLFAKAEGVKKLVIVGGYDSWRVADLLRDNKVDVILRRLHSLPLRPDDDVELPYRLPALLKEKGVRFALSYIGEHEAAGLRNLPFVAGTASAYGLGREDALRSITLDAAAILGISDRCGSLEIGKDATLIVSNGDALDMRGNDVRHAFIQGRRLMLDDHHKELYRLYEQRSSEAR